MSITAIVRALVQAGATPEMILAAVEAAEGGAVDALARRRSSDAERQRKHRNNVMSRDVAVTERDKEKVNDTESNLLPLENNLTKRNTPPTGAQIARIREGKSTPRQQLETVLAPNIAEAVIEHRQRLRKPLTAFAAERLAQRLATFPDPNQAAAFMIEKGWQSIEQDWLRNVPMPPTGPPPDQPRFETEEEFDAWWAKRCAERTQAAAE